MDFCSQLFFCMAVAGIYAQWFPVRLKKSEWQRTVYMTGLFVRQHRRFFEAFPQMQGDVLAY